jgi:hypothetical protein
MLVTLCCFVLPAERTAAQDGGGDEVEREVVDMTPDDKAGVSGRHLIAPLTALFQGGLKHQYAPREIDVDTTPSGGFVDLFYIRRNFQKRFEQAEAPVTVLLPARINAGPRDSLLIRAFNEGYRQKSVTIPMSSRQTSVVINLDPLPNTLKALSHRYFAGRSTLDFLTTELPNFRVQESAKGFQLILSETALSSEAGSSLNGMRSPMLGGAVTQQLGEDLVIMVEFSPRAAEEGVQLRSRQQRQAARDLHAFSLDIVPTAGTGTAVTSAQAALQRIGPGEVSGCASRFDTSLREQLDPGSLARALTPRGDFTDPYLRAAMRRLGELSPDGSVDFGGGVRYTPSVSFELEVALSEAGNARGYLVLLWRFVAGLEAPEYRRDTFRSLVAPELDSMSFDVMMDRAEEQERSCGVALAK